MVDKYPDPYRRQVRLFNKAKHKMSKTELMDYYQELEEALLNLHDLKILVATTLEERNKNK